MYGSPFQFYGHPSITRGYMKKGKRGKISDYNQDEVTFIFSCTLKGWISISWDGGIIRRSRTVACLCQEETIYHVVI